MQPEMSLRKLIKDWSRQCQNSLVIGEYAEEELLKLISELLASKDNEIDKLRNTHSALVDGIMHLPCEWYGSDVGGACYTETERIRKLIDHYKIER